MDEVPPLSSRAREFLDQERELPSVSATRRDRALARARSAARAGEAAVLIRPSAKVSRMRWVAVAAALVCMAAAASATMLAWRSRPSSEGASSFAAAEVPGVATGARAGSRAADLPVADPSLAAAETPSEPADSRGAKPAVIANHSTPREVAPRGATPREGLPDELRLLAPAREALARRDFGPALAALNEHARRFREGRLVEEREALRVKALTGLGRVTEARAAAAAFRQRFPHSAVLPAIGGSPAGE